MDTGTLHSFVAVARAGSFAAHARERGVDPSSISRAMALLERELGVRLFDRTTRRLSLTRTGRLYLKRVAPLLEELEGAADAARDRVTEPSGPLRVTASVAFGERWLVPRLATFRTTFPRVEIELDLSDETLDLSARNIDVGLRLGPSIAGSLVAAKLFSTRYRVVATPAYIAARGRPVHPCEMAGHDALVFPLARFRTLWRFRADRDVEDVVPRPILTVSNALAIRRAALDGMGVALLADWTVADDLKDGALVDLFPGHEVSAHDEETAVWIVYPSRAYMPARTRAFIDHLREG